MSLSNGHLDSLFLSECLLVFGGNQGSSLFQWQSTYGKLAVECFDADSSICHGKSGLSYAIPLHLQKSKAPVNRRQIELEIKRFLFYLNGQRNKPSGSRALVCPLTYANSQSLDMQIVQLFKNVWDSDQIVFSNRYRKLIAQQTGRKEPCRILLAPHPEAVMKSVQMQQKIIGYLQSALDYLTKQDKAVQVYFAKRPMALAQDQLQILAQNAPNCELIPIEKDLADKSARLAGLSIRQLSILSITCDLCFSFVQSAQATDQVQEILKAKQTWGQFNQVNPGVFRQLAL